MCGSKTGFPLCSRKREYHVTAFHNAFTFSANWNFVPTQKKMNIFTINPLYEAGILKSTDLTDNVFSFFSIKQPLYPHSTPKQTLNTKHVSFNVRYSCVSSPLHFLLSFHIFVLNSAMSFSYMLYFVSTLKTDGHYFKNIPLLPLPPLKLRLSCCGSEGYYPLPNPRLHFHYSNGSLNMNFRRSQGSTLITI
jgi:hypothetical protein